ncbi:MAG TPA: hypothetical protein VIH76_05320 [Candidatus Acidoferrales bacterium]
MPSLVTILRIAAPNCRLNRFRRDAERFISAKALIGLAISVRITKIKGEGKNAVAEIQQVGRQACRKILRPLRHNAVTPDHSSRQPSC